MKVRGRCFTVPHYLSNFPFVGRPRYFSPVQVLAGKIPGDELEEKIELVFGDIFVYYIYFTHI